MPALDCRFGVAAPGPGGRLSTASDDAYPHHVTRAPAGRDAGAAVEARLIALAVPVFFGLIALELWWSKRRGVAAYRFADAVTDLACGLASRVFHLFDTALLVGLYALVTETLALAPMPTDAALTWVFAFVAVDFLYYWWHRTSHNVNALWAVHVVHHHSEDYNLAVALRQAMFSQATRLPFYLPLALLGVSTTVFATCQAINALYQFWIHTELVGRLPRPFEAVFNTPSHHRVHHGINPRYLDRNHAGVFIVWDRLFGTFEEEGEAVVYGVVTPLRSLNPIWANFEHFATIFGLLRHTSGPGEWLRCWWDTPAYRPLALGGPKAASEVERARFVKYDPLLLPGVRPYVAVWFVVVSAAVTALVPLAPSLSPLMLGALSALLLWTLLGWGGLFERKPWLAASELARHAALALLLLDYAAGALDGHLPSASLGLGLAGVAATGASALWLRRLLRRAGAGGADALSPPEETAAADAGPHQPGVVAP